MVRKVSISIQKQQHLLEVLRGLLLSLNQHHGLHLVTSALISSTRGMDALRRCFTDISGDEWII